MKNLGCDSSARVGAAYFSTRGLYLPIVIFLVTVGGVHPSIWVAFYEGVVRLDLNAFFSTSIPWLYLFSGACRGDAPMARSAIRTIELLMTLRCPARTCAGKFLAAWVFIGPCAAADLPDHHHRSITWVRR